MVLFTQAAVAFTVAREVEVPITLFRHLQGSIAPLHLQHVAGLHLVDSGEGGAAGHHRLHQLMEQPFGGEAPLHGRMGEQHLEL